MTDEELAQVAGGIDLGPVEAVLKSGLNDLRFDKEPRCPIDTLK